MHMANQFDELAKTVYPSRRIPRPSPFAPKSPPPDDEEPDEDDLTATKPPKKSGGPLSPETMKKLERAKQILGQLGVNFFGQHPNLVLPQPPAPKATLPSPAAIYQQRREEILARQARGIASIDYAAIAEDD
jgi:hypothetical protein